ncbi:S-adenosyl-L-methionine-dependent methyltransferase, partial [Mucor mucedo]|uniref:S-adenosyl-L-methionine-dependent methyltransferase n=1 Tax=Mucor mucedo TaxID=29922 RepID=UPI002220D10A
LSSRNYQAPIAERLEKGIVVLDSACGAGAHWSKAMGEKYPSSVFTGVDISNVFPSESFSNIKFKMGNITKSIPFLDETFDFAFQKLLGLAFTSEEWDSNLKELHRVLKPGGYIELSEIYGVSAHNTGPLLSQVMHAFKTVSSSKSIIVDRAPLELENFLIKAGFTDQTVIVKEMPLNHSEHGKLYW